MPAADATSRSNLRQRLGRAAARALPAAAATVALAAVAAEGCQVGLTRRCRVLVRQDRHAEALPICVQAWAGGARTRDHRAGGGAAVASAAVEKDAARSAAWVDRLRGTPYEAEALVALGQVLGGQGQHARARPVLERAVELSVRDGDHGRAALASFELASRALTEARYLDALAAIDTGERESRLAGDTPTRNSFLSLLFDLLHEVGDVDGARRVLAAATAAARTADPAEMRFIRARQGMIHQADGSPALERQAYQEALALNARSPEPMDSMTWSMLLNLTLLEAELGHVAEARRYLEQAVVLQRERFRSRERGRVALLRRHAAVERAAGNLAEARRLIKQVRALRASDQVAWQLATEDGELAEAAGDAAEAERHYESAIAVLDRMNATLPGSDLQAWSLSERRRPFARLFDLHVRQGHAGRAFAVWDRYQRRAFGHGLLRGPASPAATGGDEQRAANHQARARLAALSQILPTLASSPVVTPPAAASMAPPRWLSGLFYFQGVDHLNVLVVHGGAVQVRRVARPSEALAPLIARFVADPDDEEAAAALGDLLVPDLPPLGPDQVLHVATARPLAEVPFAALRVRGRRLIERAALAWLPSLGAVERPVLPPARRDGAAVVLADPEGDLPEARAEARETAAGLGVPALVGAQATRAALEAARRAPVLHLGAHSGVGPAGPWLQLHGDRVLAADLLELGLRPSTVVLPTCSSAVGTAPGVSLSLAGSFLAAGAGAVVGALRSIDDAVSRRLMRDFYELGGAADPFAALARAQRRWARERPPSEWAPFVVLGAAAPRPAPAEARPGTQLSLRGAVTNGRPRRLMQRQSMATEGGTTP